MSNLLNDITRMLPPEHPEYVGFALGFVAASPMAQSVFAAAESQNDHLPKDSRIVYQVDESPAAERYAGTKAMGTVVTIGYGHVKDGSSLIVGAVHETLHALSNIGFITETARTPTTDAENLFSQVGRDEAYAYLAQEVAKVQAINNSSDPQMREKLSPVNGVASLAEEEVAKMIARGVDINTMDIHNMYSRVDKDAIKPIVLAVLYNDTYIEIVVRTISQNSPDAYIVIDGNGKEVRIATIEAQEDAAARLDSYIDSLGVLPPGKHSTVGRDWLNRMHNGAYVNKSPYHASFFNTSLNGFSNGFGLLWKVISSSLNEASSAKDPILVALTNKGVTLQSLETSHANHDYDVTGIRTRTGWVGADTGLLVQQHADGTWQTKEHVCVVI